MSRKRVIQEIKRILYLPGVKIEGMYTHLSAADCKDRTHTLLQLELFDSLINDFLSAFEVQFARWLVDLAILPSTVMAIIKIIFIFFKLLF